MSDKSNVPPTPSEVAQSSANIMDLITQFRQMDKVQALLELLKIEDKEITIAGDKQKVLNLELTTEYPNVNYTKTMVKNETWRRSCQLVLHFPNINNEKIIGTMDTQFMLKMKSHKRKGSQEIVNGLRNEVATTDIIPEKTRRKKFLGMI